MFTAEELFNNAMHSQWRNLCNSIAPVGMWLLLWLSEVKGKNKSLLFFPEYTQTEFYSLSHMQARYIPSLHGLSIFSSLIGAVYAYFHNSSMQTWIACFSYFHLKMDVAIKYLTRNRLISYHCLPLLGITIIGCLNYCSFLHAVYHQGFIQRMASPGISSPYLFPSP